MDTKHYDLVVIGGGPGGYVGAIRAAQMGMKVACIERNKLGGVCLNWGCIPTKALLHNAELYAEAIRHGKDWGIEIDPAHVKVNWEKVIGRSRDITKQLNTGVGFLFKKNKVDHIEGHARIVSGKTSTGPCRIELLEADQDYYKGTGTKVVGAVTCDRILVATGAAPRELPFAPKDGKTIISSYEALTLAKRPNRMVIIGSGAIGMEFAYFYNAFGTDVTVIEMLDRILPVEDDDVSKAAKRAFEKQGIKFLVGHTTNKIEKKKDGGATVTAVSVSDEKATQTLEADVVLVAIGVAGRTDGLFGPGVNIRMEKGHIWTDYKEKPEPTYATSVPGIYAIGDVIGPPWLAHVSSEEAVTCVERMPFKGKGHHTLGVDYNAIPGCTYTNPQIASIGMTERDAKAKGIEYTVGTYQLKSHGKAIAVGATEGFVKIITSKPYGEILGAHIIGEDASELIAEMGLAKRLEATAEDIISTMHAHPTMAESIHEAALGTEGRMIHQ
jgi:dihydrolipoamide dehydrogenase